MIFPSRHPLVSASCSLRLFMLQQILNSAISSSVDSFDKPKPMSIMCFHSCLVTQQENEQGDTGNVAFAHCQNHAPINSDSVSFLVLLCNFFLICLCLFVFYLFLMFRLFLWSGWMLALCFMFLCSSKRLHADCWSHRIAVQNTSVQ